MTAILDHISVWDKIERQYTQSPKARTRFLRFRLPSIAVAALFVALLTVSTVLAYALLTRNTLENTTYPVEQGVIPLDEGTFVEIVVSRWRVKHDFGYWVRVPLVILLEMVLKMRLPS